MTNVERFKNLAALHNGKMDHQYAAAFYILASDPVLFEAAQKAVSPDGIDFRTIRKEVQKSAPENKQLLCEIANNVFSWDSACKENPFWSLATLPAKDYLLAWEAIGIAGGKLELRVQLVRPVDPKLQRHGVELPRPPVGKVFPAAFCSADQKALLAVIPDGAGKIPACDVRLHERQDRDYAVFPGFGL